MGTIYLVRHGQAPAHAYGVGAADPSAPGLTELGFAQARATGALLAGIVPRVDAAVSGDLPRQRATLQTILESVGTSTAATVDADWDEYALPTGLTDVDPSVYDDRARYQSVLDDALAAWIDGAASPGAETYAEFAARTQTAAERVAALAGSGRNVLVASSAGTITQLVAHLWNVPPAGWPALSRTFVNASVTKILVGRRGLTVVSVNEHAHLAAADLMSFR